MKKGRLSKTEKEFIDSNTKIGVDALATKLDRSTTVIANYLSEEVAASDEPSKPTDMDLYARNEKRGVVAMTESASMSGDEKRSSKDIYKTRKYKNAIHKIKDD